MRALLVSALSGVLFTLSSLSVQAAAQQWQGQGDVVKLDPPQIVLKHQAIAELNWPAMTMPFTLASSADTSTLKPGDRVTFTLERAGDGFQIVTLTPQH